MQMGAFAAWLEEGPSSPQHSMGACLALSTSPSRKAWGNKSGGVSSPWPLSPGLCFPHPRLPICQVGLPLPTERAAGIHREGWMDGQTHAQTFFQLSDPASAVAEG